MPPKKSTLLHLSIHPILKRRKTNQRAVKRKPPRKRTKKTKRKKRTRAIARRKRERKREKRTISKRILL